MNDTRPIQEGDTIDILFNDSKHSLIGVRVSYVPQGDGDYWHVYKGDHFYEINPRNNQLIAFRLTRQPATAPASADTDGEEAA